MADKIALEYDLKDKVLTVFENNRRKTYTSAKRLTLRCNQGMWWYYELKTTKRTFNFPEVFSTLKIEKNKINISIL